eukprot:6627630-Prymnesium_polylepis.1
MGYWAYAGLTTGAVSELRATIAQQASWTSGPQQPFPSSFTILQYSPSPPMTPPPPGPPGHPPAPPSPPPLPPLSAGDCMVVAFNSEPNSDFGI